MPKKLGDKYENQKLKLQNTKLIKRSSNKKLKSEFTNLVDIGHSNVKRWKLYKNKLLIKSDSAFVHYLLRLLEDKLSNTSTNDTNELPPPSEETLKQNESINEVQITTNDSLKIEKKNNKTEETIKSKAERKTETNSLNNCKNVAKNDQKCTNSSFDLKSFFGSLNSDDINNKRANSNNLRVNGENNVKKKRKSTYQDVVKKNKLKCHDIRKAPQLDICLESNNVELVNKSNDTDLKTDNVKIKIKLCGSCDSRHIENVCPLLNPISKISDNVTMEKWMKRSSENKEDNFASSSLPDVFYLEKVNDTHGLGVFSKILIDKYVEMGPLIGPFIKEVNIPDDFNMKHIWEMKIDDKMFYINTKSTANSNWIRYVRPAETRETRNLTAIIRNKCIYLVTICVINESDELRYWTDDCLDSSKRRLEKTNCGGCNLTFEHALYYRIHCSVFHDARYSLTIRKYHCKVCGQAILGKDNIVKHAAELHNGQGAYQCQFCKKFFLRLNYLEMHRTYGCAANPHRSRPLCDFCGRKFCQPQKLKVHIKRMHSDISLSEFQCPLCLKLLGSRAAVQRHAREVHRNSVDTIASSVTQQQQQQQEQQQHQQQQQQQQQNQQSVSKIQASINNSSSLSCSRCGKLFQNKSNLKIHMLTHSGVKPFKCKEENCQAAFTTKQCLQFHYKKVHCYTDEMMPVIERSVEYTFEAYSGEQATSNSADNSNSSSSCTTISKKSTNIKTVKTVQICDDQNNKINEKSKEIEIVENPEQIDMGNSPPKIDSPPLNNEPSINNDLDKKISMTMESNSAPILSKGSKKWLGDITKSPSDLYNFDDEPTPSETLNAHQQPQSTTNDDASSIILDVDESQSEINVDNKLSMCLNVYNARHDSSNASLLVEAALDSVSDIQINTESNQNCGDNLVVSNLYPLSQQDTGYIHTDLSTERDVSVDYEGLQNDEFSAPSSPSLPSHLIHDYMHRRTDYHVSRSPQKTHNSSSPPRYDFSQPVLNTDNMSNDSDGIVAQNLTLHKDKDRLEQQLDFTNYKSYYNDIDSADLSIRKYDSIRSKFDLVDDRDTYNLTIGGVSVDGRKSYDGISNQEMRSSMLSNEQQYCDVIDTSDLKTTDDLRNKNYDIDSDSLRTLKYDLESKYEIELRNKIYESIDTNDDLRNKLIYDSSLENELRTTAKTAYNLIDSDFRSADRSFEPLMLSSSELQGLDMSARSYHGFHSTAAATSRYHHIYGEPDRDSYGPPPPPPSDVLRVVSLDLTSQSRHASSLAAAHAGLHTHHSLLTDHSRLSLDQTRLISGEHNLSVALLGSESRLLSDHTTNRLLSNDQLSETRLVPSPDSTHRMLSETAARLPTRGFSTYSMSPVAAAYHPSPLTARTHIGSPSHNPPSYHHYSGYY